MLPYQGVDCGAEGRSICLFGHPIDSSDLALMCMVNFFCSPRFESVDGYSVLFFSFFEAIIHSLPLFLQHFWILLFLQRRPFIIQPQNSFLVPLAPFMNLTRTTIPSQPSIPFPRQRCRTSC